MKLSDIKNGNLSAEWAEKGYELPKFDINETSTLSFEREHNPNLR